LFLIALIGISFFVSLISVYGFRASLLSFSGLLAMILAFAIHKETTNDIWIHLALMCVGGFWYLLVSFIFQILAPKKDQNQLLSETLHLTGNYLILRAKILTTTKTERDELLKQTFVLHNQINEKHETLREVLLTERKRSGRSQVEEKQLLIFLSTINIFELIEAKHLDYKMMDRVFGERREFLNSAIELNELMGNHLLSLSEFIIQNNQIPSEENLLKALTKTYENIAKFIAVYQLPQAREGALILRNLFDYQEQLLQEILNISQVLENKKVASKNPIKSQDSRQFLTVQAYSWSVFTQNFSLKSTLFRHSLRFTIAIVFAYCLGFVIEIQNNYWILLTILVIMRPNYGLTKERSKDRIIGTLIGAAIAFGIVLITQNMVVYSVLAIVSLILAFSLVQQNYKYVAALFTISIVFLYSLSNPNSYEVIQYRVIDTIIGAFIAVIANYLVFPSWQSDNLKDVLLNAIKSNQNYLFATQALYQDKVRNKNAYNLARKEAFLAISKLNAAFQRLTQDPKSKQKEYQLTYKIVTLNHTMISAIASIGKFIINHQTTPVSLEFNTVINEISETLQKSIDKLNDTQTQNKNDEEKIEDANKILLNKFQQLSNLRDENIRLGKTELDTETLHGLQEAYLISNHLNWLKSLSENLKKSTESFSASVVRE